ncbi:ADP-ribosylation factor-related protein 1 [Hordeum vulgare]|nr:ADP-ribosylation factor-related protein 1 [Hordeum vulgare]
MDIDLFYASTVITMGNGGKTPFWETPWLRGKKTMDIAPLIFAYSKRKNFNLYRTLMMISLGNLRRTTRPSVPWSDVHLPNAWHLSADRVPVPPVPTSGRARRDEIERRRRLLPDDLYYDDMYAADCTLWDTWLRDEHDVRRASYFTGTASGPRRAREVRGRTRVRGLTPTPSPSSSSSPPPPPRMTEEEEARLMQRVMEDSMMTHDERHCPSLDRAMALSAAGDVAIPEQMEEEEVARVPSGSGGRVMELVVHRAGDGAGSRGRELVPHAVAVTGAGGLATGGGAAGTCQLPARPRAPRTVGPPPDGAGLRQPPQRRRRR